MGMHDWLKSGVVLCNLANQVKPGSIAKINSSTMPFKQMENIKYFMDFARRVGVPESSMFGTPDLYEDKNMGGGLCTDMSAGFNATLEVQRPTERADYCV